MMKQVVKLNESDFNRLIKETVRRVLKESGIPDEDEPVKQERGEVEKIHHTSKAFAPGDKILYWRSVSGAKSAKFVATVKSFDGTRLVIDENGIQREYDSNNGNIQSNSSWMRPMKDFCMRVYKNINQLPPYGDYIVDYTKDENGEERITILDKPKQKKYWYTRNGEFVKVTSNSMLYASKFKGKPGLPEAVKANTTQSLPGYVDLEEDWIVTINGKFFAWRIEKKDKIGEACPWLKTMSAPWKSESDKRKRFNPFVED